MEKWEVGAGVRCVMLPMRQRRARRWWHHRQPGRESSEGGERKRAVGGREGTWVFLKSCLKCCRGGRCQWRLGEWVLVRRDVVDEALEGLYRLGRVVLRGGIWRIGEPESQRLSRCSRGEWRGGGWRLRRTRALLAKIDLFVGLRSLRSGNSDIVEVRYNQ